ncbi:ClpXP adapter SpxH family protein [Adhaeribacter soli]|uniref:DsbA family protein n=1 Tax=Adhaeribacter soli TaxID=2607655 RepID=A0A5N1ILB5_9BACT|nr:ClpXP adapter SpxH family protein [Adhaeribacter soli]KAA9325996.1 DsbA family protein [Adhaeribacter soli]
MNAKTAKTDINTASNPLLCDPSAGSCEIPGLATTGNVIAEAVKTEKPVRLVYFTDPICSSCWGIEPQLRKLKLEYGDDLEIEYRMGGLLKSWDSYGGRDVSGPETVAPHWDEASAYYEMPIDGDVWLEDPLPSSYPPSIAFKAAQLQDKEKAVNYMRRLREMLFLEKKNITKWEHLEKAAAQVGLDPIQLLSDYGSKAKQLFEDDLALARQLGVRGFPTIFFYDEQNNQTLVYGSKPYESYETVVQKIVPKSVKKPIDATGDNLFRIYPTLTLKEFAVLGNVSKAVAESRLKELQSAGKVERFESKNGPIWKRK